MKKYYILIATGAFMFFTSCKENTLIFPENVDQEVVENDNRTPVKPDYVEVVVDYDGGDIQFIWPQIDKERIKSINISYEKDGKEELIEVKDFKEPLVLEQMEIGYKYNFVINAIGLKDEVSKPFAASATPKPFAYDVVASSVAITGGSRQAEVIWLNPTKQKMQVDIAIGGEVYSSELEDKASTSMVIPIDRGDYDVEITVTDSIGRSAAPILAKINVVDEVELDRTGWKATANNEYTAGENTGLASALIDGNVTTYWHTDYTGAGPGYPHWAQFDMLKVETISKISMARRQNNATGMTKFKLEGSLDGTKWVTVLNNQAFNPNINDFQEFSFTPQEFRYLRMTATEGPNKYTHLAEIKVYAYK